MRLRVAHSSGQFSDSPQRQVDDAKRLTAAMLLRRWHWLTGTEGGPRSQLPVAFKDLDDPAGLKFRQGVTGDVWVLHRKDLFTGKVETRFHKVVDGVAGQFGDRGVLRVTGQCPATNSKLTILVAHYVTSGQPNRLGTRSEWNQKIADKVGALGTKYGQGRALVFYGGDQNTDDRKFDTFRGAPFTSLQDELGRYEPTTPDHGRIDVIASYDHDTRVKGLSVLVLDDSGLYLDTDHFLIEGEFNVSNRRTT